MKRVPCCRLSENVAHLRNSYRILMASVREVKHLVNSVANSIHVCRLFDDLERHPNGNWERSDRYGT